jgi:hypothetical protein
MKADHPVSLPDPHAATGWLHLLGNFLIRVLDHHRETPR